MPKAGKRKIPVTVAAEGPSNSSKPQSSRTLIRKFHVLLKQQTKLQNEPQTAQIAQLLKDIDREINNMGGLPVYQRMSTIGQGIDRGGGSERVLIGWLRGLNFSKLEGRRKHRLLEVGALKPDNYHSCNSWLDVTAIDLRSQHPSILEKDFLTMDPDEHRGKWDIVSLSLVLNFVPDARDRGRMLELAHTILCPGGLLFLALPLPCVMNSRYTTLEHVKALMEIIGFTRVEERWKAGGKMIYWLFRKVDTASSNARREQFRIKVVLRQGNRNNFVILL
ncbi:hypothetical protein BV25DRAFT_1873101 [Artomyces pyxidatus]|uniref:Uncharacterized protein n=1 Tax=Artomyces pyxidatus TaxID=48021 RepID=A0ACB8SGI6_9AGAM|nr:hypothetical protein BV25DRAFT_1873101 [Artomyces pyxidatus]